MPCKLRLMRRSLALILLTAGFSPPITAQTPASSDQVVSALEDSIVSWMERDSILGLSVAIVDGDTLLWAQGFGFTDQTRSDDVTPETVFSLQSISKTYTAAGFLAAVQRGWFGLDEPMRVVWPEFSVRSRVDPGDADRITYRQLLAHRSGLPHEAPRGNNFDPCACLFAEHVESIRDVWLLTPPGTRYAYSNLGYDLLAYALTLRSGESFPTYQRRTLFDPLGMNASTYDFDEAIHSASFARGQIPGGDAPLLRVPMTGAGGMYSTVLDMARFISFALRNGTTTTDPIDRFGLRSMATVQFPVDGQIGGYGLGAFTRRWRGAMRIWHAGGGYGYTTQQDWVPAYHLGVVVLTNDGLNGAVAGRVANMALDMLADLHRLPVDSDPPPYASLGHSIGLPLERLRSLTGNYRSYGGLWTFAINQGRLRVRTPGGSERDLVARNPTEFTDGLDRYRFHLDPSGQGAWIEDLGDNGQDTFVLNERPGEPSGPGKAEWANLLGDYWGEVYGQPISVTITQRNGYLWASTRGGSKLIEYAPGLFFTVWGESLEFRGDTLRLRSASFVARRSSSD